MADTTRDIVLRLEGKFDAQTKLVNDLYICIYGNGREGLKADIAAVRESVEDIKAARKEEKDNSMRRELRGWQVWLLVIGEAISLVGVTVALFFKS